MRHTVPNSTLGALTQTDMVLIKTDAAGNEQWLQTFGGSQGTDVAYSVIETGDGGYALAGQTKPGTTFNQSYYYIVKLASIEGVSQIAGFSNGIPPMSLAILAVIAAFW